MAEIWLEMVVKRQFVSLLFFVTLSIYKSFSEQLQVQNEHNLNVNENLFSDKQLLHSLNYNYRISSYSFHGNRSQYIRPKVTLHKYAETIQRRKLYEEVQYIFAGCGENLKLISLTSLVICKDFKYKKLRKISSINFRLANQSKNWIQNLAF